MEEQKQTIINENEHHHSGKYVRVRRKNKSNIKQKYIGILSIIGIILVAIIAGFGAIAIANFFDLLLR